MRNLLLSLALLFAPLTATAQTEGIVAGLSQNRVSIDASFVGSEILIFGAVKRDAPAPDDPLGVVIAVEGPGAPVMVRKKEKRFGIWINSDAVAVNNAPGFYAIATSAPFDEVLSEKANFERLVSIDRSVWILDRPEIENEQDFADAVIRIREDEGLYQLDEGSVRLRDETLFDTSIQLPSNIVEGLYSAHIYLTRNGNVVSEHVSYVRVQKVGLERWAYNLAHDQPLIYGLMSLAIAIVAGYLASTLFRLIWRT